MSNGEQSSAMSPGAKAVLALMTALAWFGFGLFQLRERGLTLAQAFGGASQETQMITLAWLGISIPLLAYAIASVVKAVKSGVVKAPTARVKKNGEQ